MKREIMEELINWKNATNKKCLVLIGARQVGKTYIVREFASQYYSNLIELNFETMPSSKLIFEGDLDIKHLIAQISLFKNGAKIEKKKSLIFLDEIQACPKAIVALKVFTESKDYDVIASGSMLGVSLSNVSSFPVGYIKTLVLYPFSFKEFLWANGISDEIIGMLHDNYKNKTLVEDYAHEKFKKLFLQYVIVGGMPEVVKSFVENNDFYEVFLKQKQIINDYRDDMAKYASKSTRERVRDCFDSIPNQLAKDNKKFRYKLIQKGGNARYFGNSITWICDTGIASKLMRLKTLQRPLKAYQDVAAFKIYLNDTGLLISMYDEPIHLEILNGNLGIFNGGIFENVIYNILKQKLPNLYYYESGSMEIDFITVLDGEIVPIEVKSGYNTRSKSLTSYIQKYNPRKAIKLSLNNLNCNHDVIECYPLYMAMFLGKK